MNTSKHYIGSITTALLLGVSPAVFSATAICVGPVSFLSNHVPGGVYVAVGGSGTMRICSLTATLLRTTPENCKHYVTMLSLALAANKIVTIYVDNAPTTACSSIPNWFDADVRYVHVTR